MADELGRRSHALLMKAMEVQESERSAYVQEVCGDDTVLLSRVRTLLGAMNDSRGFLETPALGAHPVDAAHDRARLDGVIGGYRILRVIGAGGMATVYEAMQDQPRRRVALKVMKRGLERTSALHRFRFETQVLARLRHPGIAQIYEAGMSSDGHGATVPFFAMEHIEGARTLTAYAAEHSLSLPDRLALFAAVCDAVQHGHQSGVIHRDLKPSNILVDASGQPKVIDFGIARASDPEQAWITRNADLGQVIGTLNSMSPEQCDGRSEVDIRADVYALGVVLYELACGRLPHDLNKVPIPEALRIVKEDAPPRPSTYNHACRGDVDAIVLKAMEKEPDRRYPTAAALAADIRRSLRSEPIEARPPSTLDRCRRFARRHRTLVAVATALVLAIIGGGVASAAFGLRAVRESHRRLAAEQQAVLERDAAVWQGYIANIAAAIAAFGSGEVHQTRSRLAAAAPEHRGWEWQFINGLAERALETIDAHADLIVALDRSQDGRRLASVGADGVLRIWEIDGGGVPLHIKPDGRQIRAIAFSPDGSRLLSGDGEGVVQVWDAATGEELNVVGEHSAAMTGLAWGSLGRAAVAMGSTGAILWDIESNLKLRELADQPGGIHGIVYTPDGQRLVTWGRDGAVWVRTGDGAEVLHRHQLPTSAFCAAVNDRGDLLAAGGNDGYILLWDLHSGELLHELRHPSRVTSTRSLTFTPSGDVLVSGHGDRTILLWSSTLGERQQLMLRGHEEAVTGLAITPDGSRLYSASWDRTIRMWSLENDRPAVLIRSLRGHEDRILDMVFSPDGTLLASGGQDGMLQIWDVELGAPLGGIRAHDDWVTAVAFSPDGEILATASRDGTMRLWNTLTGALEGVLAGHRGPVQCIAFSPDGTLLASGGDDATVRTWDVSSRQELRAGGLAGHRSRVHVVAFSPDGRLLVSGSNDQTARVWDPASGAELRVLAEHSSDVMALAFSADGATLYTGSRDQTVRVWDMTTFHSRVLAGHGQLVTSLSLSPDGKRLAAGSWFGEVVLWDLPSHDIVLSFKAHDTVTRAVAFDRSGRWLASASFDQTIRLYDALPPLERHERRARALQRTADAAALVEELFLHAPDASAAAALLHSRPDLPPQTRHTAQRLILRRSLQGQDTSTQPH